MITLEQAKNLKHGTILISTLTGHRWKVNGEVKRWVRDQDRVAVPLKHGLYAYDTLTNKDFNQFGVCDLLTLESEMPTSNHPGKGRK